MNWLRKLLGLHVHEWSQWAERGRIMSKDILCGGDERQTGFVQDRQCKTCGLKQYQRNEVL